MADKLLYTVQDFRKKRVIIDTDAACEADDPFAIAHALMSRMLDVRAICAEHFVEEGSMERSYDMIQRVMKAMHIEVPVLHGERGSLAKYENEEPSEAVRFIIQEAERESDNPLYVLCIGATTNVAKALIIRPQIAQKMTIVTIGGNPHVCGNPGREFNFGSDVKAANTILHCGGEVWQIPNNVYGSMHIGFAEIQKKIYPYGEIGKLLYENMIELYSSENGAWSAGESWALGDSPAVGVTLEPNCGSSVRCVAPWVNEDTSYTFTEEGPKIKVYTSINSRFIIEDFICKLQILYSV